MLESRLATWARQSPWARPVGVAGYRALDRLRPTQPGPRVLVNAIPKSGTHLASGLFDLVPGFRFTGRLLWVTEADLHDDCRIAAARARADIRRTKDRHYLMGHAMHHHRVAAEFADAGMPVVTMVRDPRAIAASAVRYFEENRLRQRDIAGMGLDRREELAQYMIDGGRHFGATDGMAPLQERCRQFIGWRQDPNCLVVKFDDLIGARGGGSDEQQFATISRILAFTGADALTSAEKITAGLYSADSHTFSVGKVRSWESVLTSEQIAQVEEQCADSFAAFDYAV